MACTTDVDMISPVILMVTHAWILFTQLILKDGVYVTCVDGKIREHLSVMLF